MKKFFIFFTKIIFIVAWNPFFEEIAKIKNNNKKQNSGKNRQAV